MQSNSPSGHARKREDRRKVFYAENGVSGTLGIVLGEK